MILPCGDTGVTEKAGQMLASLIDGDVVVGGEILADADNIVLGTNVHFGKFNKRFKKLLKSLEGTDAHVYIYIVGAEIERENEYIERARSVAPAARDIKYFWGELNPDKARFFKRFALKSFVTGRRKDGLPKPRLLEKEIRALAREICGLNS